MSSAKTELPTEHLDAAEKALDSITDNAKPGIGADPSAHLYVPPMHGHIILDRGSAITPRPTLCTY